MFRNGQPGGTCKSDVRDMQIRRLLPGLGWGPRNLPGTLGAETVESGALGVLGAELLVTFVSPSSWIKAQNPTRPHGHGMLPGVTLPNFQMWVQQGGRRARGAGGAGWELPGPPRRMDVTVTAGPACIRWSGTVVQAPRRGIKGRQKAWRWAGRAPGVFPGAQSTD